MKQDESVGLKIVAILVIFALILGGKILYAYLVYGDTTCAFANCVKVENVKP